MDYSSYLTATHPPQDVCFLSHENRTQNYCENNYDQEVLHCTVLISYEHVSFYLIITMIYL